MKKEKKMEFNELYEYLTESEMFTTEELELITCINGANIEVLNDALYARYGYHDIEQMNEEL